MVKAVVSGTTSTKAKITVDTSAGPQQVSVTVPAITGGGSSTVSSLNDIQDVTVTTTTTGAVLQVATDGGNFVSVVPYSDFSTPSDISLHGGNAITTQITSGALTLTNKTITSPVIDGTVNLSSGILSGGSPLVFEGSTADSFETTLAITDPTADRTITVPNATGTIITHGMFSADATVSSAGVVTLATVNSDTSQTGSSTAIPVITANAKGLVTALSTASITTSLTVGADSGTNDAVSLASNVLNFEGGNNITTTVSDNNIKVDMDATPVLTGLTFEGSTADSYETTLTVVDPTADRIITFPNATTTVVGTDVTQTLTNKTLTTPTINTVNATTFTANASADIVLDAGGADVKLKDDGTNFGRFSQSGGELVIKSGSGATTALTFSGANVTTAGNFTVGGDLTVSGTTTTVDSTTINIQNAFVFEGATDDSFETTLTTVDPTADRTLSLPNATDTLVGKATTDTLTNKTLTTPTINGVVGGTTTSQTITTLSTETVSSSSTITLDATTDIILDADGADVILKDAGTEFGRFTNSSGELVIKSSSSSTTALTMSGANVTVAGNLTVTGNATASGSTITLGDAATDTIAFGGTITGNLIFEGSSADSFETTLAPGNPSSDITITLPSTTSDTLVGIASTQTLTNKTFGSPDISGTATFKEDAVILFEGATNDSFETTLYVVDPTADRTVLLPNASDTLVGKATTDTLTNKTLTTPTITTPVINTGGALKNGSSSAGYLDFYEDSDNGTNYARVIGPSSTATVTLTLPAATDTLVGKATTDTLTNKSIDLANNTLTGSLAEWNSALQSESFVSLTGEETLTNKTLTTPTITKILSTNFTIDASGDISLDAAGGDIKLKDANTNFGRFTQTGGELVIKSSSSATTALTFSGANVTAAGNITVDGDITVTGSTTLNGNTTLGNATSDTITYTGRVNSHILPSANTTYDLGSSTLRWNDLWLSGTSINLGGASLTSDGTVITLPSNSKVGSAKIPQADTATGMVVRTVPLFTKAGGLSSAAVNLTMKAAGALDFVFTGFTKSDGNAITTQTRTLFSF